MARSSCWRLSIFTPPAAIPCNTVEPRAGIPYPPLDPEVLDCKTPAAARAYSAWRAYGYSKYGAILLTHELVRRYAAEGISSYSLSEAAGAAAGGLSARAFIAPPMFSCCRPRQHRLDEPEGDWA